MGRIDIQGGLERDEVYNKFGDQIGVAVYDLGDAQVRANIVALKDELKSVGDKYETRSKELQEQSGNDEDGFPLNAKPLLDLNIEYVDEMIGLVDDVFGEGFCAHAIGEKNKNPNDLWEVIGAVIQNYGVKAQGEIDKYVNRATRRAAKQVKK